MNAVLVSLVAVAGTLLGSLSTYLFQRRIAMHAEAVARNERLRQDRLAACGTFAAAITDVKRAVITAWSRRNDHDEEWQAAWPRPIAWAPSLRGTPTPLATH